jgi:pimeloyl-ACP methyl ester carboxylesterase
MTTMKRLFASLLCALGAAAAHAVGTSFPADFPVIEDASLGKPVIGFGAAGAVARTPVILLHGNNDVPYPTACQPFVGKIQQLANYLESRGYAPSELWALGYQGDQCDLLADNTRRSAFAHTATANVPDLRRFVAAVLAYTGAKEVDIVGHSLGVIVAREWLRQDPGAQRQVRRFVAIDGPNHGIINCSPSPLNYYQLVAFGGFTPHSAVCQELGSPNTPFLQRLNHGRETTGSTRVLVIRNADTSFVYFAQQDGFFTPVPALDVYGNAVDFSRSPMLEGAHDLPLTGQGAYDAILGTAHLGILNSPTTWAAVFDFLSAWPPRR